MMIHQVTLQVITSYYTPLIFDHAMGLELTRVPTDSCYDSSYVSTSQSIPSPSLALTYTCSGFWHPLLGRLLPLTHNSTQ